MFEGDQVVIQKSTTAPDPFAVFRKYLRSCDSLFPLCPSYGFVLMVLCPLSLGSYLGYMCSFLALLGAIPCVLVVLQVSLRPKFKR